MRGWLLLHKKILRAFLDAFDVIFTNGRKLSKLHIDKEKEFVKASLQKKMKDEGIHFYVSQNEEIKAIVVERFKEH